MKNILIWSLIPYLLASENLLPAYQQAKRNAIIATASKVTLSIYNSEDYIANGSDGSLDIVSAFENKVLEEDGVNIEVVYSTFDTNEIMLSNLQTGAQNYDLICTSDYMVEKMMANSLVVPFKTGTEREALYEHGYSAWEDDNYDLYSSPYFDKLYGDITVKMGEKEEKVSDYMRGYMWGTLGIMYNPEFSTYASRGLSAEDVKKDMATYSSLWNEDYTRTFQIKDSMRDSYAIALLEAFKDEFELLAKQKEEGTITSEEYNKDINLIFNNICHIDEFNDLMKSLGKETYSAQDVIDSIERELTSLKDNSYGLEVDSGKTDIQTGNRTGINMAWSGDAVYAIDSAEEFGTELYYSVPKIGANVWLDAWVIPTTVQTQEYAQKFIDFISDPEIAAANMDYIGYTSTIAGDDVLSLAREWYDVRMPLFYEYDEEEDGFVYDENEELVLLDEYKDLSEDEFTSLFQTGNGKIGDETYSSWEDYSEKNDLGWTSVNLGYFFDGSLNEYEDGADTIFYTDEYETYTLDNGESFTTGRSFFAQYPPQDIVDSLMVMEDYGDNNEYVLTMWESVKSGTVPVAVTVILVIEAVLLCTLLSYFLVKNGISKSLRKKRRLEKKA